MFVFLSWPSPSGCSAADMSELERRRAGVNIEPIRIFRWRAWGSWVMLCLLHELNLPFDSSDVEAASYLVGESFDVISCHRDLV